jgi:hypothetical protein
VYVIAALAAALIAPIAIGINDVHDRAVDAASNPTASLSSAIDPIPSSSLPTSTPAPYVGTQPTTTVTNAGAAVGGQTPGGPNHVTAWAFSGVGDAVLTLPANPANRSTVLTIVATGAPSLFVFPLTQMGTRNTLVLTDGGTFRGSLLLPRNPAPAGLEIDYAGSWNVTVTDLNDLPDQKLQAGLAGNGRSVERLDEAWTTQDTPVQITASPSARLYAYGATGQPVLVHTSVSNLPERALIRAGTWMLVVLGSGPWNVTAV